MSTTKLAKKELQVAKNSTCATLADEQRRQVNWQRQRCPDIKAKHTYVEYCDKPNNRKSSGSNRNDNNRKHSHNACHQHNNATSVARTNPQKNIVRRDRGATMREN